MQGPWFEDLPQDEVLQEFRLQEEGKEVDEAAEAEFQEVEVEEAVEAVARPLCLQKPAPLSLSLPLAKSNLARAAHYCRTSNTFPACHSSTSHPTNVALNGQPC